MKIANTNIGDGYPPYIVAEISGNHCGILGNAIHLIRAAKRAGADAVKTQCYDPDSMTLDIKKPDFIVQEGLWKGRPLYDLYRHSHTPPAWHKELYRVARQEGITIFSSVFDQRGVDLLEDLGCPAFKIASFEITDIPLIAYAAKTRKPIIISTGAASDRDILDADAAVGSRAAYLHCTSEYPAVVSRASLNRISELRLLLPEKRLVGISDHTIGPEIPIAGTVLGVAIIEKHLKLAYPAGKAISEDDHFSMGPTAFASMVDSVKAVWDGMHPCQPDGAARQFRRSLYAIRDIEKGEPYSYDNIRSIRPGYGLPPKMLKSLIGKKSKRNWRRGDPLS
jgi:N-acetylneuraminate synthase